MGNPADVVDPTELVLLVGRLEETRRRDARSDGLKRPSPREELLERSPFAPGDVPDLRVRVAQTLRVADGPSAAIACIVVDDAALEREIYPERTWPFHQPGLEVTRARAGELSLVRVAQRTSAAPPSTAAGRRTATPPGEEPTWPGYDDQAFGVPFVAQVNLLHEGRHQPEARVLRRTKGRRRLLRRCTQRCSRHRNAPPEP